jgi:hypothetical protein
MVVSRDPRFKRVVAEKTLPGGGATVKLPGSGRYYWYVEGKNRQQRLAMRSDIQSFNVTSYAPAGGDTVRLMAAFAPSVVRNAMASKTVNNSLDVAVYNSFLFSGQYWFSRPFGIEGAYQRKSAELYKGGLEGTADQEPLAFVPQSLDLRMRARLMLGGGALAPELHARVGYMYKTFYTYYAKSRTAFGLTETGVHHVSLGVGGKLPFALDKYGEVSADLAKPLRSAATEVTGGQHLALDLGYYLLYPGHLTVGFGGRYASATYTFVDDSHGVDGTLQETSYSVLGSLGWGF